MKNFNWDNKMRSRGRHPRLLLWDGKQAVQFLGKNIPGVIAVRDEGWIQQGKWSHSAYKLALQSSWSAVEVLQPFEGWGSSWEALENGLQVLTSHSTGPEENDWAWDRPDKAAIVAAMAADLETWKGCDFGSAVKRCRENDAALAALEPSLDAVIASGNVEPVYDRVRNFTPHPVNVLLPDGTERVFQSEGSVRLASTTEPVGEAIGSQLVATTFGDPEGLPGYVAGTLLIVSQLVKSACHGRSDLVVPADVVRDTDGRIIGCRSLAL